MPMPLRFPLLKAILEDVHAEKQKPDGRPLSLRDISTSSNIDYAHIHRVFHGQSFPSRNVLFKICKAMNCSKQEAASIFTAADYRIPDEQEIETILVA